jgi:hypothetical protein
MQDNRDQIQYYIKLKMAIIRNFFHHPIYALKVLAEVLSLFYREYGDRCSYIPNSEVAGLFESLLSIFPFYIEDVGIRERLKNTDK